MKSLGWIARAAVGATLIASVSSAATYKHRLYDCLGPVEQFADIGISLLGTAQRAGLDEVAVREYARQALREAFGDVLREDIDVEGLRDDREEAEATGILEFTFWAVSGEYPIAFYFEGKVGSAQCLFEGRRFYSISHLGIIPKVEINNAAKNSISEIIDTLVKKFPNLKRVP